MLTASTTAGGRRISARSSARPQRSCEGSTSPQAPWVRRSKRHAASSKRRVAARRSAAWPTSSTSWRGPRARRSPRHDRRSDLNGGTMDGFGVQSEVGKLRKVMVHRPELSLQRLTPSNHDELLFDDVLWVERAQHEHDRFVARMRERGVEVFLLHELLAEALAASDEARQRLIELVASEYTV